MVGHARESLALIVPGTGTAPARYYDQSFWNVVTHVTFVFGQIPYFSYRTALPDWSIGLEMAFYAVFPFMMVFAKRVSLPVAAFILLGICGAIILLAPGYAHGFAQPSFLPLRLHIFLAGMLLAGALNRSGYTAIGMVALAIVMAVVPIDGRKFEMVIRLVLVGALAFMVHGPRVRQVQGLATWADGFLGLKPFVVLGDLSYGVYLAHLLVLIPTVALAAGWGLSAPLRFLVGASITIAIVYPAAWVMRQTVELPGIALGKRLLGK